MEIQVNVWCKLYKRDFDFECCKTEAVILTYLTFA